MKRGEERCGLEKTEEREKKGEREKRRKTERRRRESLENCDER